MPNNFPSRASDFPSRTSLECPAFFSNRKMKMNIANRGWLPLMVVAGMAGNLSAANADLVSQGKALFQTKICFTCHQTDPAVPALAGQALRAPKYIGDFWGKETLVHKGFGGPLEKVVFGPGYFYESVKNSMLRVAKGALAPMPPPPPTTDEEIMALMAYVRSLSKKDE